MIRYLLSSPEVAWFGRKVEVEVWLDAEYRHQRAFLQIAGGAPLIAAALRALESARGLGGRALNVNLPWLAIDLSRAMDSPAMQPFSPRMVAGEDVLARRGP
ncbi:MAG: hypothetical protein ACTHU0_22715 [Kofleriaceae bacterium]